MLSDQEEKLATEFTSLIDSPPPNGRQKEQVVQDFLETNSELIPTPNRLNHQLHFGSIVSKFPLSTELTTDYVYITKSSDLWRITLVELETPDKKLYTADLKVPNTTAEFNAALNQVRSWRNFIDENRGEVLRKLAPLLQPIPMRRNPIEFNYQLIIGRSKDKNLSEDRKRHFRGLIRESNIDILTYDTLLNWYRHDRRYKKNILRLSKTHFTFKHLHMNPEHILAYVGPDHLEFTTEHYERLSKEGYEMDKWQQGELLTYNRKYAASTYDERLKSGSLFQPPGA